MIHRDRRKPYESSSGFGQIINRAYGRGAFGFADVDLVLQRGPRNGSRRELLVILEHKEPTAEIGYSQMAILRALAIVIHESVLAHRLDPKSGVYVIRGRIAGRGDGHRETYLDGPQSVERMLPTRDDGPRERFDFASQSELFTWIDSLHGGPVKRAAVAVGAS